MRASRFARDGSAKRLTLRRIQQVCSWKVFELGKEYRDSDRVVDLVLKDGTVTGTILGTRTSYLDEMITGTALEHMVERPQKERRAAVSLVTGRWTCTCPYSQVAVCSHAAALLICAAKDLGATVPAGDLPQHDGGERTTLLYRRDADRILAQATTAESLNSALDKLLELADSCKSEGDVAEGLLVCLGIAESLLSFVDYHTYSQHFYATEVQAMYDKPPSTPAPQGMDAAYVAKFNEVSNKSLLLLSYTRIRHEQKVPCMKALHRLYVETVPWRPSKSFSLLLRIIATTDRDNEFVRSLHDPVVPDHTPDPRRDNVEFKAVMSMVDFQLSIYDDLKDGSILETYAKRYRDDPGICARYVRHLHYRRPEDAKAVAAEGRRLFPDFDAWL